MDRVRLDQLLVERGLAAGRGEAQSLIRDGHVADGDRPLTKPGQAIERDADLRVTRPDAAYASRGGLKLAAALDRFPLPVAGSVAMDVGASTGGFTDVLLRRGAARVYAIDVGYGQLAWTLRNDPRVVVLERTNIRHLASCPRTAGWLQSTYHSSPSIWSCRKCGGLLGERGEAVCLIKPQFEVGKGQVGKGGVVRDPAAHAAVLTVCWRYAVASGWLALVA